MFTCGALLATVAGAESPVFRFGRTEYRSGSGTLPELRRSIAVFQPVFDAAVERMYRRHALAAPDRFRVYLARNADDFRRAAGRGRHTAALYRPESDRFYFQSPLRLRERGRLQAAVEHELCHQIAARARLGAGRAPRGRRPWLEESYCEAISSAGDACQAGAGAVNRIVRAAQGTSDLARAIEARGDRAGAARGPCLARLFGRHLVAEAGERTSFALVTEAVSAAETERRLSLAFASFQAKFR